MAAFPNRQCRRSSLVHQNPTVQPSLDEQWNDHARRRPYAEWNIKPKNRNKQLTCFVTENAAALALGTSATISTSESSSSFESDVRSTTSALAGNAGTSQAFSNVTLLIIVEVSAYWIDFSGSLKTVEHHFLHWTTFLRQSHAIPHRCLLLLAGTQPSLDWRSNHLQSSSINQQVFSCPSSVNLGKNA